MSWTLLLIGAAIGLSVDEVQGVERDEAAKIVTALENALVKVAGRRVVPDSALWRDCEKSERCLDDIRARTNATDIVVVAMFKGVTKIRVEVRRFPPNDGRPAEATANLKIGEAPEDAMLEVAKAILPNAQPHSGTVTAPAPPPATSSALVWPAWVTGGIAVASAGGAVAFGVSADHAASALRGRVTVIDEFARLRSRADTHGDISNALLITSIVAVVTTAAWVAYQFLMAEPAAAAD